jgi:hypothetical protein
MCFVSPTYGALYASDMLACSAPSWRTGATDQVAPSALKPSWSHVSHRMVPEPPHWLRRPIPVVTTQVNRARLMTVLAFSTNIEAPSVWHSEGATGRPWENTSEGHVPQHWASASAGWGDEVPDGRRIGEAKARVGDEVPDGGLGNCFMSFAYLKTLRVHCRTLLLELFSSILCLSNRVIVITMMGPSNGFRWTYASLSMCIQDC